MAKYLLCPWKCKGKYAWNYPCYTSLKVIFFMYFVCKLCQYSTWIIEALLTYFKTCMTAHDTIQTVDFCYNLPSCSSQEENYISTSKKYKYQNTIMCFLHHSSSKLHNPQLFNPPEQYLLPNHIFFYFTTNLPMNILLCSFKAKDVLHYLHSMEAV